MCPLRSFALPDTGHSKQVKQTVAGELHKVQPPPLTASRNKWRRMFFGGPESEPLLAKTAAF